MMQSTPEQPTKPTPANKKGVVHVQAFLGITDPATKEVIVEQRA